MGFEGFRGSKWPGLVRHKRSKSFPHSRGTGEDNLNQCAKAAHQQKLGMEYLKGCAKSSRQHSSNAEIQNSFRHEIFQLEKRLQDQVSVRCALEKALGYKASSHDINEATIPKPAMELIKEIAVLELEVVHLEQYLLSLYRTLFDPQISSLPPSKKDGQKTPLATTPRRRRLDFSRSDMSSVREILAPKADVHLRSRSFRETTGLAEEKLVDSGVQRSHSSLSHRSSQANRTSPPADVLGKANTSSNVISLAEHLGTCISDHIPETPNKLSEDMVKCISKIYCKLANPPLVHGFSSPTSSSSSMGAFSPKDQCNLWSPGFTNESSFDVQLEKSFGMEGLKDFSEPYSTMVEVHCIHRDSQKLGDVEYLLQNFRSLISRLEEIDPRKMTHEEKLAFWINVHNALVMHAFLAYGIPQNNMKRMFLLLKAAYNVGGQIVSADVIQNSILGCRMSRPGQWLRLLLSPRTKFKMDDERRAYAIDRQEPLLYFALSSGSHSDPAVRIYTPKMVRQELETAKEEYIRAAFGMRKDQKILLPKLVESFAKDSGLCPVEIVDMGQQYLPDALKKSLKRNPHLSKSRKSIEWVPHNFAFRYLILKELVK